MSAVRFCVKCVVWPPIVLAVFMAAIFATIAIPLAFVYRWAVDA